MSLLYWALIAATFALTLSLTVLWLCQKARRGLKSSLDDAQQIVMRGNDPMLAVDLLNGSILYANPAISRLLGYSHEELLQRTLVHLHPPHLHSWSAQVLADVWEKRGLVYSDLPLVRQDGELIDVEVSASIINYRGQPTALLQVRDIRERLKLEAKIREQNLELERVNARMKDLFGRYVSGEVRDAILAGEALLGGQEMDVSVLFCDLRDFTALSASTTPQALVQMLNRYFTEMVAAIREHRGIVDKFIGDAVMAVFGAPVRDESHALHALLSARAMLERLSVFNAEQERLGLPRFRIGIGIASGKVVAGNLGAEERLEYTVVGDTVNLASRIEALTKSLGMPVLMNQAAAEMAGMQFPLRKFPDVAVRGLASPINLFGFEASKEPVS